MPSSSSLLSPLLTALIASLNHLLAQEPAARQQLARHLGKLAVIDAGAVLLRLRATGDGYVDAAPPEAVADVTIRVKLSDLPLMLQQPERAVAYVKIEGDAEFANTISQLGKTVRWDAEHDLERLVGQIAATRLVAGAKSALAAADSGRRKLGENVAEFLLDEQALLVRKVRLQEMAAGVVRMRDDVERLGKRIERLEQKLGPAQTAPTTQQSLDLK